MHGLTNGSTSTQTLPDEDVVLPTSAFLEAENSTEQFRRALRVKARKTLDWLVNPKTAAKLLLSVLTVTPMEIVMFRFMKWQKGDAYLMENPPISAMAHPSTSAAGKAIQCLCSQLKTGKLFPEQVDSIFIVDMAKCFLDDLSRIVSFF